MDIGDEISYTIQTTFRLLRRIPRATRGDSAYSLISHFPDGTEFVTADEPFELFGDHIVWPISTDEKSARWARRHLTLKVSSTKEVALVNTAQFTDDLGSVYATATVTTTFLPGLTYDLEKHVESSTTITAGERVTYTLWLTTNGPHFPAIITDVLPEGTIFLTATAPFSPAQPVVGRPLVWPLTHTHFSPGGIVSRTLVTSAPQVLVSSIVTNTAMAGDHLGYHVVQDSVTVSVQPWPMYGLRKQVGPAPVVTVGQRVTYSLVVTTTRPDLSAALTDTLPADTAFISASGDYTPTAPGPGDTVVWSLGPADFIEGIARHTLALSVTGVPSGNRLTNTAGIAGKSAKAVLIVFPTLYKFHLPLLTKRWP
jgi:uncharacterized repeat protein (TIGR01451 family)